MAENDVEISYRPIRRGLTGNGKRCISGQPFLNLKFTFSFFAPYTERSFFIRSIYDLKRVSRASLTAGMDGIPLDVFSNLLFLSAKEKGISQYLMISEALLILHSLRM